MNEKNYSFIQRIESVLYVVNVRPAEGAKDSLENKLKKMIVAEAISASFFNENREHVSVYVSNEKSTARS